MRLRRRAARALLLLGAGVACGCRKAPLSEVGAGFALADLTWFAEEETLFAFWEVSAEQGINDLSAVEIRYRTDTEVVDWTPIDSFAPVHLHLPVDCGVDGRCGSTSLWVPDRPRDVRLRLRYHPDGDLALTAPTVFNIVDEGPAHTHRSLVAYGVFDEANEHVQWRARHQFPTLRNQEVEELGLRRTFRVREQGFGTAELATPTNPYGYGVDCPDSFTALGFGEVLTQDRAAFNADPLPLGASDASTVCGSVTAEDALGEFETGAIARKNPEVRPAFPLLRSPIESALPVRFFLAPCDRIISSEHEEMQRQRLQMEDVPTTCVEDWDSPGFIDSLIVDFRDAVEDARVEGQDMVLVVGLHQDEAGVSDAVQAALAAVVPAERDRSTPRLAGAFVFDSDIRGIKNEEIEQTTLWCPTNIDIEATDASTRSCAVAPDAPQFDLGPLSFGFLPILPPRTQYLDFVDEFSAGQAGEVTRLTFLTPEFPTTSDHEDLGDFGVVTFLNQEAISAEPDDAFSHCITDSPALVAFRSPLLIAFAEECVQRKGADVCDPPLLTLDVLPTWHTELAESAY
jgi:hypothetical protein